MSDETRQRYGQRAREFAGAQGWRAGPAGDMEDTAAELVDWLADNGVHLADGRGEVPYQAARSMIQRFLEGSRRSTAFPGGVAPRLVLEAPELSAHQEAAALDAMPDEVLERLPGHDGPGHTEDGPAGCRRCALLRRYGPALELARHRERPYE